MKTDYKKKYEKVIKALEYVIGQYQEKDQMIVDCLTEIVEHDEAIHFNEPTGFTGAMFENFYIEYDKFSGEMVAIDNSNGNVIPLDDHVYYNAFWTRKGDGYVSVYGEEAELWAYNGRDGVFISKSINHLVYPKLTPSQEEMVVSKIGKIYELRII